MDVHPLLPPDGPPTPPRRVGRVSPVALQAAIGEWLRHPGPLYERLATAIAAAIHQGELAPGAGLPAERPLAATLSVARGTAVAAYQRLVDDGLVERRQGSGTRILGPRPDPDAGSADRAAGLRARRLTSRFLLPDDEVIDLGISVIPDLGGLPADALTVDPGELERASQGHGYQLLGLPALRQALADAYTADGLPTRPEQILVTQGGQHGVNLSAALLVQPGDRVAIESPTYPGAIDVYARAGARLEVVARDSGGARPDAAAALLRPTAAGDPPARLVYLMPGGHNPTGDLMPTARREAFARLVDETGAWVVEDATLDHLVLDGTVGPTIASSSRSGRVLTIGSFSKLFWGGLRLGWIRGPEAAITRLARLRAARDLGSPALTQLLALRLWPEREALAAQRRQQAAAACDRALALLGERLPSWRVDRPAAGLGLWAQLPERTGDDLAAVAGRHGVAVLPGSACAPDDQHRDRVRLSFLWPEPVLDAGIGRLAAAWEHLADRDRRQPAAG